MPVSERHLSTDRRTVAVAHGAETATRQEAAWLRVKHVLRRPHLMLTDIGDVGRIRPGHLAGLTDDLMRLQDSLAVLRLIVGRLPLRDLGKPVRMVGSIDQRKQCLQHHGRIADHRSIDEDVLIHLTGIDIDLHDLRTCSELLRIQCDTIREAGTDRQHEVCLVDRLVRGVGAMHPDETKVPLVPVIEDTRGHQRIGRRHVRLRDEIAQRLTARLADRNTATEVDHRTRRLVDELCNPGEILCIDLGIHRNLRRLLRRKLTARRRDVLRDIHEYRTLTTALCDAERLPHRIREVLDSTHSVVVLRDRHRDSLDIRLLEGIAP